MKKILFAVGDREFLATQERLIYLAGALARSGCLIDILTFDEEVFSKASALYKGNGKIAVNIVKTKEIPVQPAFRDNLLKTLIKHIHHLSIPQTDIKLYKLIAFDDFWGNIGHQTYQNLHVSQYSSILIPLPSEDDFSAANDNFFSSLCFMAKEEGIPLAGISIYSAVQVLPIYFKTMDYFIVKEEWEKKYLNSCGVASERIFLLTDEKEAYFTSTLEDTYKNLWIDSGIDPERGELVITVMNHPKFRNIVKSVLETIGQMDIPKVIFLMKKGYFVKELTEDDIIGEIYMDTIKRAKGKTYIVEPESRARVLMLSDVVISASYITPMAFSANYDKLSIVFNPLHGKIETDNGVLFINALEELRNAVSSRYHKINKKVCISDVMEKICKKTA